MPFIQLEFQKDAFLLFLTRTQVETLNNDVSISSTGSSIPAHGFCEESQSNHSHVSQRALLKHSKFRIPSPQNCVGLVQMSQLTLHLAPVKSCYSAQRKHLHILFRSFMNCLGVRRAVSR